MTSLVAKKLGHVNQQTFCCAQSDYLDHQISKEIATENNFGYQYPKLLGNDVNKAFNLRKAGLGLLGNMVGDKKAVACIEDTAVDLNDLPDYIDEFTKLMDKHQQKTVYYAHAGAGEIHLRPILTRLTILQYLSPKDHRRRQRGGYWCPTFLA